MDRLTAPGWLGLYLVVAVCLLLFVPLGLGALGRGRWLVRWWPVVAVPAVVALLMPRGVGAGVLCVPYLMACLAVPVVLRRERLAAFAGACLPVAAVGLVAERAGVALLGFPAGVLGLTAAHFSRGRVWGASAVGAAGRPAGGAAAGAGRCCGGRARLSG